MREDSKLIAEFMSMGDDLYLQKDYITDLYFPLDSPELAFHLSWDWLMPVVDKIESLGYRVIIETNYCRIETNSGEFVLAMGSQNLTKREATYKAVVEFCVLDKVCD